MLLRAIIISNSADTIQSIEKALIDENFEVLVFQNSAEGMKNIYVTLPDAVILEDSMSTGSGDLCYQIRRFCPSATILLGDEEGEGSKIVSGLERGADFYMRRPISTAELLARVKSLLRRRQTSLGRIRQLLNVADRGSALDHHPHNLTPTEFRLLAYMVMNRDRVIPTEEFLGSVWAGEKVTAESLKFHISQLRHKLNHGSPHYIFNHWGVGYRLVYEPKMEESGVTAQSSGN